MYYQKNDDKNDNNIIQYTFTHFILFIVKNLVYGGFYISLISIWILDRYLFSKLWEHKL
jgi:hypothetical protein